MNKPTTFKKGISKPHPVSRPSKGYSEKIATPVTLAGVIAPWTESLNGGRTSDYKLMTNSGLEYFIVADHRLREVLSTYCWEEVRIMGLFNILNMTLIPHKIYPSEPTKENIIDLEHFSTGVSDSGFELDEYERTLAQQGKLDLAPEYLAS